MLFVLLQSLLLAQASTPAGSIQGTVVDPNGSGIPGVRIAARQVSTGLQRSVESNTTGRFQIGPLPAGEWTLHMEHPGFTALDVPAFPLSIGQTITQRWTMILPGVHSSVEVVEQPDVLDAGNTSASVALGGERIEESPARGRNYLGFVALAPGLAQTAGGGQQRSMTGIRSPLADSGFSFAGIRARNNGISIDGVDNRDETTGGNRVAVGLEMVQEFRVAGVSAGAEFGGAAGGMINVVTRTGVNAWHGDATYFAQTEVLNARRTEMQTAMDRRPEFRRAQPGASVLGPLRRDKTFFAIAAELEQERSDEWSETSAALVPRINRILPGSVSNGLYPASQHGADTTSKFNHQPDEKDTFALRYSWSRGRVLGDVQGPENVLDQSAAGNSLTADHSVAASWLRVINPTLVHEIRGQWGLREQRLWPNVSGRPLIEIPGLVSFGEAPRLRSERSETHIELADQWNWTISRHRLSAGGSFHHAGLDSSLANRFAGVVQYASLETFEQNRSAMFWQVRGDPHTTMSSHPVGLWFQERWQAREGLLIEAGLRYDKQVMPDRLPSSPSNWGPRLGMSWRPNAKTPWVFRAGFGLFADRYPLAYLNEVAQKGPGGRAIEYVGTSEATAVPATWNASRDFRAAYGRKFSAGWERGFGSTATLHVETNFVRGYHLPRIRNSALTLPAAYLLEQTGLSSYRGVSVSYNRRAVKGLAMLLSYDLGRTYDDGSDFDEQPSQPGNIRADWSRSRQYQAQRFSASAVVDLPLDELLGGPGWFRKFVDEWMLAPAWIAGSGRPYNALLTYDPALTGAYPVTARPPGVARNAGTGPSTLSFDARLMKTIPFQENRSRLQLGVEGFNILNRANAVRLNEAYASPQGRLPRWGSLIESAIPRQIQLFVQFEY